MKWTVCNEVFDTLEDAQEYCFEQEIIYYRDAMEYLIKHDPSLQEAIGYADDCGYDLKNVTSELLATLVYQNNLLDSISMLDDDIANSATQGF